MLFSKSQSWDTTATTFPVCPDLSENEVGTKAARELREYMRNERCHLRSLAIRKADIDDGECRYYPTIWLEPFVSLVCS